MIHGKGDRHAEQRASRPALVGCPFCGRHIGPRLAFHPAALPSLQGNHMAICCPASSAFLQTAGTRVGLAGGIPAGTPGKPQTRLNALWANQTIRGVECACK